MARRSRLIARRKAREWTQESLAHHLGVARNTVARWEQGSSTPEPWNRRPLAEALGVTLDELDDLLEVGTEPKLALISTEPVTEPWELHDALTRCSIDVGTIGQMDVAVSGCAEAYPSGVPGVIGLRIHRQLHRIKEALQDPQPLLVRYRLTRLLGYACGLAANVASDARNLALARGYFEVAMLAAQEADDRDLAAWTLANRSIACYASGDIHAARVATDGASKCAKASSPRRRAWILALNARSLAAGKEQVSALRMLEDSRTTLEHSSDRAGGTDFFDEARLGGIRGSALLSLGQLDLAATVLQAAIDQRPASEVKGRALLTLDLARCRLLQAEPHEAARLAAVSLDIASDSFVQPIAWKAASVVSSLHDIDPALAAEAAQLIETKALEGPP